MIPSEKYSAEIKEILEQITKNNISELRESIEKLYNALMLMERETYVGAAPYQRSSERKAQCNGFKNKKIVTRLGEINLAVPQVRDSSYYPSCLEKGTRVEQALKLAIAESYLMGVSTRKMKEITKELCGTEFSSTQVSRFAQLLDEEVNKFRTRALGRCKYVYFDAQYEYVRDGNKGGAVVSTAVLKAVGVTYEGRRELLDISCSLSEAEVHWRQFMEGLVNRGLHGIELMIADNHPGLKAAMRAVFPTVPHQRCIFHLAQNAGSYATKKEMRKELCEAVKMIYSAEDKEEAQQRMQKVIQKYKDKCGKFCEWLEENFAEGLVFFQFPKHHWSKIRTVNLIERMNEEQRRRTRVVRTFPNVESCERLVVMLGMRINDEWASGPLYIKDI